MTTSAYRSHTTCIGLSPSVGDSIKHLNFVTVNFSIGEHFSRNITPSTKYIHDVPYCCSRVEVPPNGRNTLSKQNTKNVHVIQQEQLANQVQISPQSFAFTFPQVPLGRVGIHFFSPQLQVN